MKTIIAAVVLSLMLLGAAQACQTWVLWAQTTFGNFVKDSFKTQESCQQRMQALKANNNMPQGVILACLPDTMNIAQQK